MSKASKFSNLVCLCTHQNMSPSQLNELHILHTESMWDAKSCSVCQASQLSRCAPSSPRARWQQQWQHIAELPQSLPCKNRSGEGGKDLHGKTVMQNPFSNITSSSSPLFSLAISSERSRRELSADTSYDLHIEAQAKHLQILVPQNLIWTMHKCLNSEEKKF